MCGITACAANEDVVETLSVGLRNLEYRGYDSAGIATRSTDGLTVVKRSGGIDDLVATLDVVQPTGTIGIGHTRWSTHGEPTDANAHPHTDCTDRVAIVHNGIIENHAELRDSLEQAGHRFTSETDTEVVPHLVEDRLDAGDTPEEAFRDVVDQLAGSYALAMVTADSDTILATRNGSPLVLGVDDDRRFLASDVPSFLEYTSRVCYLQDGDIVRLESTDHEVTTIEGQPVDRPIEIVDWQPEEAERKGYDHYMLKEINEQPTSLEQTLDGRITPDQDVALSEFPPGYFADYSDIQLVACGTSYHAALYARQLLVERDIPAHVYSAGEYATTPAPVTEDTLVIGVTQSGETADTLASLRNAADRGAQTLAVTNVIGSTAARECDDVLFIRAGPEIGVAATKTFSSQVATLTMLVHRLAADRYGTTAEGDVEVVRALERLPADVGHILDTASVDTIMDRYRDATGHFFIGRGVAYPVALEGALKFKEITYEHAEGFAAGELKHGPLALVTENTPVFAVFSGAHDEKTLNNVQEVQSRGAPVIGIASETSTAVQNTVDEFIPIPDAPPAVAGILANVQLQLVAYHVADALDRAIDKPRNLAKSVTVE